MNSLRVPLKELFKYLSIFYLFGILDFLYGEGLNVSIKSGEIIIAQKEILGLNYHKNNEDTDELIFETKKNKNFLVELRASAGTLYSLNSFILECTSKKLHNIVFDQYMNILDVQSLKGLYTALDSNGNMVGNDLKESDLKSWGKKKSLFKKETQEWVNIDFEKRNTDNMNYLLIEYSGNDAFKLPLSSQKKSYNAKKEEEFNLKKLNLKIYQWDGGSWKKLTEVSPLFRLNNRKVAIKFYKNLPLKFRIDVTPRVSEINAIHLASAERVILKNINIAQLPSSLKANDTEYFKITADEKFNTTLNLEKNNLCVLKVNGYFEVKDDKNNIPKGLDDIINRFLSRIKFW